MTNHNSIFIRGMNYILSNRKTSSNTFQPNSSHDRTRTVRQKILKRLYTRISAQAPLLPLYLLRKFLHLFTSHQMDRSAAPLALHIDNQTYSLIPYILPAIQIRTFCRLKPTSDMQLTRPTHTHT